MNRDSAGRVIAAIYRNTQCLIDTLTRDIDLSSGTLDFFYIIINNEGLTLKELSRKLEIGKATTTKAVNKLARLGYIEKRRALSDKRSYHLYITEKSREISASINSLFKTLQELYKQQFTDAEYDNFLTSLEKLLITVQQEIEKKKTKETIV